MPSSSLILISRRLSSQFARSTSLPMPLVSGKFSSPTSAHFVASSRRGVASAVFMKGIPQDASIETVKDMLSVYGEVKSIHIFAKESAMNKTALVHFGKLGSAIECFEDLDKSFFLGNRIHVDFSTKAPYGNELKNLCLRFSTKNIGVWASGVGPGSFKGDRSKSGSRVAGPGKAIGNNFRAANSNSNSNSNNNSNSNSSSYDSNSDISSNSSSATDGISTSSI